MTDPIPAGAVRVLATFAHPDDETLGAGAVLARLAAGADVTVVTATRGERGEVIPGDLKHLEGDGQGLAAVREAELSAALAALGVRRHVFLDSVAEPGTASYTDSGMAWAPGSTVRAVPAADATPDAFSRAGVEGPARLLAGLIRAQRPDLVITEEPDGGYGHPDHVHIHRVTMRAVELAAGPTDPSTAISPAPSPRSGAAERALPTAHADGDRGEPRTRGVAEGELGGIGGEHRGVGGGGGPWRVPIVAFSVRGAQASRRATAWLQTHPDRPRTGVNGGALSVPEPDGELASQVVPDGEVDFEVDVTTVAGQVVAAMTAHRTQVQLATRVDAVDAVGWFALSNDILAPIPARAGLQVAAGHGTRADLQRLLARVPAARNGEPAGAPAGADVGAGAGARPDADDRSGADPEPPPSWYPPVMTVFSVLLGVILGATGTAFHRWSEPWGLVIGLVAVLAAGVLARTFADARGLLGYGAGVVLTVLAMTYLGPGGDVIVADDSIGIAWLFGVMFAVLLGAFAPRRWFRDDV
ncbi:PIG-L family deacetylase [Occultella glacieicola]|uniref:PIG-L family deacetylase n=1 Tax=Occultella glacieicola TaxID=2518684 RepID=UPI001F1A82AD|nr:PIG-L family deacetylase [Occultella glacieicola]